MILNINQISLKLAKKGFDIYYYNQDSEIGNEIKECNVFIPFVSENSFYSAKQKREYECIKNNFNIDLFSMKLGSHVKLPPYLIKYNFITVENSEELEYRLEIKLDEIKKDCAPVAFICHSSNDKNRFVSRFIEKLKKYGVNPWYDDSEINGENFIEKIDDGLKKSSFGIIIFSKNLENSKFALRELDCLITKSIYEDYTLIPIKIDAEVELPQLIKPIQIIKIKDLTNYDSELNKILQIIFENKQKKYIESDFIQLPKCDEKETNIFLELCEICLDYGFDIELDSESIFQVSKKYYEESNLEVVDEKIAISLKNLENNGYLINEGGHAGRAFTSKRITSKGFCFYFNNFINEHESKYQKLISAIFNDEKYSLEELAEETNLEYSVIEALIRIFRKQDYIFCKNNLTILNVTFKGEEYFKRVLEK